VKNLVIAVWCETEVDHTELVDQWATTARDAGNLGAATVSVAVEDQGRFAQGDPVDVLIALTLEDVHDIDAVPGYTVLSPGARRLCAWEVDPHHAITGDSTVLTMVSFVTRAEHLTHEEFARHWTESHAPLARKHHVGLADYTQNVVVRSYLDEGADIDGIAELRFRSRDDFELRFYDSDEGRDIIRDDVKRFIARPSAQAALMREVLRVT
jgi:uncharacterized protein (TIGR02118 family)